MDEAVLRGQVRIVVARRRDHGGRYGRRGRPALGRGRRTAASLRRRRGPRRALLAWRWGLLALAALGRGLDGGRRHPARPAAPFCQPRTALTNPYSGSLGTLAPAFGQQRMAHKSRAQDQDRVGFSGSALDWSTTAPYISCSHPAAVARRARPPDRRPDRTARPPAHARAERPSPRDTMADAEAPAKTEQESGAEASASGLASAEASASVRPSHNGFIASLPSWT